MELLTTLNPLCILDEGLTAKFVLVEHVVFGISVPLNLISLWCIYSDKSTRIKWYLFNCQLWFAFSDAFFSILATPILLLPLPAYYSYGILNYLGISMKIQGLIGMTTLAGMMPSIIHLFFHRHQTIIPSNHKRHIRQKFRLLIVVFFYVYYGGIAIPLYTFIDDDKYNSLKEHGKNYPCLYPQLYEAETVLIDPGNLILSMSYTSLLVVSYLIIVVFLVSDSFHSIHTEQKTMSRATRDHVRRSLATIVIQIMVMFSFICIPIIVLFYQVLTMSYNQTLTLIGLFVISFHATAGTLTGICLNKKYRSNIMKKVACYSRSNKIWFARRVVSQTVVHTA